VGCGVGETQGEAESDIYKALNEMNTKCGNIVGPVQGRSQDVALRGTTMGGTAQDSGEVFEATAFLSYFNDLTDTRQPFKQPHRQGQFHPGVPPHHSATLLSLAKKVVLF